MKPAKIGEKARTTSKVREGEWMKKRLAASLLLALFLFCIGCRPPEGVAMQSAAAQAGITPGVYVHTAREIEQAYRPRLECFNFHGHIGIRFRLIGT